MKIKKGDIFQVVTDCESLTYVCVAIEDSNDNGFVDVWQLCVSTWREKAVLNSVSTTTVNINRPDADQRIVLLSPRENPLAQIEQVVNECEAAVDRAEAKQ